MSKKSRTKKPTRHGNPSVRTDYASCVARASLRAVADLETMRDAPPGLRRVINYLRGNQFPPGEVIAEREGPGEAYALFWAQSASWARVLLERLIEEGYVTIPDRPAGKLSVASAGERLLRDGESVDASVLPQTPRLGAHPDVEERLCELRRRLAKKIMRPPYGVFSNTTLAHLAARRPRNLGELAAIPGLGEQRLRQFGRSILRALKKEG